MVETAKTMGFPLMAGSSLPVTWRLPAVDVPWGPTVSEAVCVGYGGMDSYDFHGLETLQCMVERRKGGETGVVAVSALRGEPSGRRSQPVPGMRADATSSSSRPASVAASP